MAAGFQKIAALSKRLGGMTPEHAALDLVSEVGEVVKEVSLMTGYGRRQRRYRKKVEAELGDVFYSLANLANSLEVDLNKSALPENKELQKAFQAVREMIGVISNEVEEESKGKTAGFRGSGSSRPRGFVE